MEIEQIYERAIKPLPVEERLRLARLILEEISAEVVDLGEEWSEDDLRELTAASWLTPTLRHLARRAVSVERDRPGTTRSRAELRAKIPPGPQAEGARGENPGGERSSISRIRPPSSTLCLADKRIRWNSCPSHRHRDPRWRHARIGIGPGDD